MTTEVKCACGHALSSHGPALGCPVCNCTQPPGRAVESDATPGWLQYVYPDHSFDQADSAATKGAR